MLRYSRERALKSSKVRALRNLNLNFEISNLLFAAQVAFLLQEPADPTDRERQAGLRALRLPAGRLLSLLPALALPRHRARRVAVRAP